MMPMKHKIAKIVSVAVWLILIVFRAHRAQQNGLTGCLSVPAGAFLPLWAAQDAGIFKKHGLAGGADRGGFVDAGHRGDSLGRPRHSSRRRQQSA